MSRLVLMALLVSAASGISASAAQEDQSLAAGIRAYRNADFSQAAKLFNDTVKAEPGSARAYLYLGMAFSQEYIPGAASPENELLAQGAEKALRKAVELAPNNKLGLMCLGMLLYQVGENENTSEEIRNVEEAKQVLKRLIALDSRLDVAIYNLGAMDAFIPCLRVFGRGKANRGPDDAPPLRDEGLRRTLVEQWGGRLTEAVGNLNRALTLDPNDTDAMRYLVWCWRAQADLAEQHSEAVALKSRITAMQDRVLVAQEAYSAGRAEPRAEPSWGAEIVPFGLTSPIPFPPPPPPPPPGGPAPTSKSPLPKKEQG